MNYNDYLYRIYVNNTATRMIFGIEPMPLSTSLIVKVLTIYDPLYNIFMKIDTYYTTFDLIQHIDYL